MYEQKVHWGTHSPPAPVSHPAPPLSWKRQTPTSLLCRLDPPSCSMILALPDQCVPWSYFSALGARLWSCGGDEACGAVCRVVPLTCAAPPQEEELEKLKQELYRTKMLQAEVMLIDGCILHSTLGFQGGISYARSIRSPHSSVISAT